MSHLPSTLSHSGLTPLLEEASKLRRFNGPPAEFWPALVSVMARLAEASRGVLIVLIGAETYCILLGISQIIQKEFFQTPMRGF